ncbi:MAG: nucleoside triphosphate pyrophosphohydrolase [Dehalococcoidia bacterium]|nr:nucleoside triphosphate pyrophosphohydrolase [Dehalococcoidia bacterium]
MKNEHERRYGDDSAGDPEDNLGTFEALVNIIEHLRSPGGCPWDREQTNSSLKRNILEECYEVLEAIDAGDSAKLSEELGDILVQVVFHTQIAREAGEFRVQDTLTAVNRKLIRRHPHVFGNAVVTDAREVERNWEKLKEKERGRNSPVDGIPKDLPALTYAQLMQDRVGKRGFEWDDISGVLDKVVEEVNELKSAPSDEERAKEMGDLLFTIVNLARWLGIHAEDALRQGNARFRSRYTAMENLAVERGLDFPQLPLDEKEEMWQEAKRLTED